MAIRKIVARSIGVDVIVAEDIAANAITAAEISSGAVTTAKLATDLVVTHGLGSASTPSITFTGDTNTGIFSPTADTIAFAEGGAEVMRINSSGNVLIGTDTNPSESQARQVLSTSSSAYLQFARTSTTVGGALIGTGGQNFIVQTYTGAIGSETYTERMRIDSSGNVGIGTNSPSVKLHVAKTSGSGYAAYISSGVNVSGSDNGLFIGGFDENSTSKLLNIQSNVVTPDASSFRSRFVVRNDGVVLIGTNVAGEGYGNNNAGMTFRSTGGATVFSNTSADYGLVLNKTTYQSGSTCYQINFRTLNQNVGGIFTDNSSTTYSTTSDYRLKENIEPMTGALVKVQALKPVTYTWKADGSDGQGFIAHEVQSIVPQAVIGEKDAVDENDNPVYQGIDTSFLVATLTAAIQEQQVIIDALKARLDTAGL